MENKKISLVCMNINDIMESINLQQLPNPVELEHKVIDTRNYLIEIDQINK